MNVFEMEPAIPPAMNVTVWLGLLGSSTFIGLAFLLRFFFPLFFLFSQFVGELGTLFSALLSRSRAAIVRRCGAC
jgi:hypothetical protein